MYIENGAFFMDLNTCKMLISKMQINLKTH